MTNPVHAYHLAHAEVVIQARRIVEAHPGVHAALELALRRFNEAERAKAMRPKVERVEPWPDPPGMAS
jgi:hypothetical protein